MGATTKTRHYLLTRTIEGPRGEVRERTLMFGAGDSPLAAYEQALQQHPAAPVPLGDDEWGPMHAISCTAEMAQLSAESLKDIWPEHFRRPWGAEVMDRMRNPVPAWEDQGPLGVRQFVTVTQYRMLGEDPHGADDPVVDVGVHSGMVLAQRGETLVDDWCADEEIYAVFMCPIPDGCFMPPVVVDEDHELYAGAPTYLALWTFDAPPEVDLDVALHELEHAEDAEQMLEMLRSHPGLTQRHHRSARNALFKELELQEHLAARPPRQPDFMFTCQIVRPRGKVAATVLVRGAGPTALDAWHQQGRDAAREALAEMAWELPAKNCRIGQVRAVLLGDIVSDYEEDLFADCREELEPLAGEVLIDADGTEREDWEDVGPVETIHVYTVVEYRPLNPGTRAPDSLDARVVASCEDYQTVLPDWYDEHPLPSWAHGQVMRDDTGREYPGIIAPGDPLYAGVPLYRVRWVIITPGWEMADPFSAGNVRVELLELEDSEVFSLEDSRAQMIAAAREHPEWFPGVDVEELDAPEPDENQAVFALPYAPPGGLLAGAAAEIWRVEGVDPFQLGPEEAHAHLGLIGFMGRTVYHVHCSRAVPEVDYPAEAEAALWMSLTSKMREDWAASALECLTELADEHGEEIQVDLRDLELFADLRIAGGHGEAYYLDRAGQPVLVERRRSGWSMWRLNGVPAQQVSLLTASLQPGCLPRMDRDVD